MEELTYTFEGDRRTVEVTDGEPGRPLVLLLHGTAGDVRDMTDPASHPDRNHDHSGPLDPDVTVGWRAYPGVGVWSCCALDPLKDVRSWRDVLMEHGFATAAYSQVDNVGFLARPVRELAVVMNALAETRPDQRFVLLTHSRGGLLARKFIKDHRELALGLTGMIITLHAPHTGSALATVAGQVTSLIESLRDVAGDVVLEALGWLLDMASSDAFTEMVSDGGFLTELSEGEAPLKGVDYFTFGGVSVRLSRVRSWVYTLDSALPQWNAPPFLHRRTEVEVPGVSPVADSLPNIIEELSEGRGDLLTADARARLPFATHQTNAINHAEALWDPILQAQVLRLLGVEVAIEPRPVPEPSFWG